MIIIGPFSHLDHSLTIAHLRFLLDRFKDRSDFFTETVVMPPELPELICMLRGPAVGLPAIPDGETTMRQRPGRSYRSRMMSHTVPKLFSRQLTVIAGPHAGFNCALYTAFGGPLAPREPGDPDLGSLPEDVQAASRAFWAEHALVPG